MEVNVIMETNACYNSSCCACKRKSGDAFEEIDEGRHYYCRFPSALIRAAHPSIPTITK